MNVEERNGRVVEKTVRRERESEREREREEEGREVVCLFIFSL